MITPIDVVDSAVKIGLGVIISGLATYWLAKANHNKTIEKDRAQRWRDILEVVAQQVANFHQLALRHWGFSANWTSFAFPTETTETALAKLDALRDELNAGIQRADKCGGNATSPWRGKMPTASARLWNKHNGLQVRSDCGKADHESWTTTKNNSNNGARSSLTN